MARLDGGERLVRGFAVSPAYNYGLVGPDTSWYLKFLWSSEGPAYGAHTR